MLWNSLPLNSLAYFTKNKFITRLKSWYQGRPDRRISNSSKQQKSLSLLDASGGTVEAFVLAKEAKSKPPDDDLELIPLPSHATSIIVS